MKNVFFGLGIVFCLSSTASFAQDIRDGDDASAVVTSEDQTFKQCPPPQEGEPMPKCTDNLPDGF